MADSAALPLNIDFKSRLTEFGVPAAVLLIVLALIAPMPDVVLDLLLVIDIMTSLTVLMVALYINRPVDFSVFPTTLLLLTLFRLSLNVSATRLILMHGSSGTHAAGAVIEAFGNFVVGGSYVIGIIIFLTLIAIQYVVINHGAVRISEVTARFTLDALPGKQMSIDSDLSAGLIDEDTARARRHQLAMEAEFYGSMDGATRFTQRDAIASILITGINIIGGLLIGVFQHEMELRQAVETYTVLTIGDGLVTVIPALMVSITGGLIVTRANADENLGENVQQQIFGSHRPLLMSAGVLVILSTLPGLPMIPFLGVAGTIGYAAWRMRQTQKEEAAPPPTPAATPAQTMGDLEQLLRVETLSVAMGLGLVRLIRGDEDTGLLKRLTAIRRQLATELGFLVPPIRFKDNMSLGQREYVVYLKGLEISRFEIATGCELAIPSSSAKGEIKGQPTVDPAFRMPAVWIPRDRALEARQSGYTVVDPISVMGTHLLEVIRCHAHEMFSRQEMKRTLDRVSTDHPKVVEELIPKLISLTLAHKIFQNLLRERVSIRDAVSILEPLGEAAVSTRNHVLLTEYVRQSIKRAVVTPYISGPNELHAFLVGPKLEERIATTVTHGEHNSQIDISPELLHEILSNIQDVTGVPQAPVVVITSAAIRFFMHQLVESAFPNLVFLSHSEIPATVRIESLGVIQ